METKKTIDQTVIHLRVVTFVSIIIALVSATFTVTKFVSYVNQLEQKDQEIVRIIERLDARITKTTGRNAEAIDKLEKIIK